MDVADCYSLEDGVDYDSYSVTTSTKAVFNQDNASLVTQLLMQENGVEGPLVLFGEDGIHWSVPSVESRSYAVGGIATVKVLDMSMTGMIAEDAISNDFFLTLTETTGTAPPTVAHMIKRTS